MEYFIYDNDTEIPARWDMKGKKFPELYIDGAWVPFKDAHKWATCACPVSKEQFDTFCTLYGVKNFNSTQ